MASATHTPVLAQEFLEITQPHSGDTLLDVTLGHGGHAHLFLDATAPTGTVVGIDADNAALNRAREKLRAFGTRVTYINAHFSVLKDSLAGGGIVQQFSHVLFDLGVGSHQLSDATRAFSFQSESQLTMKFGQLNPYVPADVASLNHLQRRLHQLPDASDIIQGLSPTELAEVIHVYGEERYARRIAQAIHQAQPRTALALSDIVRRAVPAPYERGRIHPATRTFQALRLAVNRELESLRSALPQAIDCLHTGGKISVISFHSLEDRIVKHLFRDAAKTCHCPPHQPECTCETHPELKILTKRPRVATAVEVVTNPRARSAKLRVAMKT